MLMEDYYTEDEIAHMCWYFGQYSDNLTYNQRAILVEKYENMIDDKIKEIEKKRSWNDNINRTNEKRHNKTERK